MDYEHESTRVFQYQTRGNHEHRRSLSMSFHMERVDNECYHTQMDDGNDQTKLAQNE